MQRTVDLESDPEFRIHTTYHSDFFVLRTEVKVNGKSTDVKEGGTKGPVLSFRHSSGLCPHPLYSSGLTPFIIFNKLPCLKLPE